MATSDGTSRAVFLFLTLVLQPALASIFSTSYVDLCQPDPQTGVLPCEPCPTTELEGAKFGLQCAGRGLNDTDLAIYVPSNVQMIDLSSNSLTKLTTNTFYTMSYVQSLDLSKNDISGIDDYAFDDLYGLQWLILSRNKIRNISAEVFYDLSALVHLDLSFNDISYINPAALKSLGKVEHLYLQYNPLKTLAGWSPESVPKATFLNLESTGLSSLPPEIFEGRDLRDLILARNEFQSLPSPALNKLGGNLISLDISDNHFKRIEAGALQNCSGLKWLKISNNEKLQSIEKDAFKGLGSLKTLILQYNRRLSYLHPNAFGADKPNLQTLLLRQNKLKYLQFNFVNWGALRIADLQDNPWNCDCHLKWIKSTVVQPKIRGPMKCHEPEQFINKDIRHMQPKQFSCESHRAETVSIVVSFILILLTIGGLVIYAAIKIRKNWKREKRIKGYSRVHGTKDSVELEWDEGDLH